MSLALLPTREENKIFWAVYDELSLVEQKNEKRRDYITVWEISNFLGKLFSDKGTKHSDIKQKWFEHFEKSTTLQNEFRLNCFIDKVIAGVKKTHQ